MAASESQQIDVVLKLLHLARRALAEEDTQESFEAATQIHRAQGFLRLLRVQVAGGYHRNPYDPFRVVGVVGNDVHSVAYRHAKDNKLYRHDFEPGTAQALAVERHGKRELLIAGDVPLWDEF